MQNEYQLRLKDLAMNEKVKELTERFMAELDVDKNKFDTLLQEKNEQELEYEEKMKQYEEKHQAQLATLDGQYQAKIMAEVERYDSTLSMTHFISHELNSSPESVIFSFHKLT